MPSRRLPTASGWLAIKVELAEGRGKRFAKPAGRLFAASPSHTFAALARQIDAAFARWDIAHLHEFELGDGTRIGPIDEDTDDEVLDERRVKLSRLRPAEAFTYTFDFGDTWFHRCLVEATSLDPTQVLGSLPQSPMPYFGWGMIPDQYGRTTPQGSDD